MWHIRTSIHALVFYGGMLVTLPVFVLLALFASIKRGKNA